MAVEHDRLQPGDDPVGTLAPHAGAYSRDRIAVPELFERHRAAQLACCELFEQLRRAQRTRRERGEHCRREERAGKRQAAHLLEHDHHVDQAETEATRGFGYEQARPTHLGEVCPQLVGDAAVVFGHGTHVRAGRFVGEKAAHCLAQRLLVIAEREIHCRGPSAARSGCYRRAAHTARRKTRLPEW